MVEKFDEFAVDTTITCAKDTVEQFHEAVSDLFRTDADALVCIDVDYTLSQVHVYGTMPAASFNKLSALIDNSGFDADDLEAAPVYDDGNEIA